MGMRSSGMSANVNRMEERDEQRNKVEGPLFVGRSTMLVLAMLLLKERLALLCGSLILPSHSMLVILYPNLIPVPKWKLESRK